MFPIPVLIVFAFPLLMTSVQSQSCKVQANQLQPQYRTAEDTDGIWYTSTDAFTKDVDKGTCVKVEQKTSLVEGNGKAFNEEHLVYTYRNKKGDLVTFHETASGGVGESRASRPIADENGNTGSPTRFAYTLYLEKNTCFLEFRCGNGENGQAKYASYVLYSADPTPTESCKTKAKSYLAPGSNLDLSISSNPESCNGL